MVRIGLLLIIQATLLSSTLFNAMKKELERSVNKLQMKYQEKPYFISYRVIDEAVLKINSTLGSISYSDISHNRQAYVEVRVGSYTKDNSLPGEDMGAYGALPISDDEVSIRHALWLLTDKAYKSALERFLQKKAKSAVEAEPKDVLPDFSFDEVHMSTFQIKELDTSELKKLKERWEKKLNAFSLIYKENPKILSSFVKFVKVIRNKIYINSEGDVIFSTYGVCYIESCAQMKSDDEHLIGNFYFISGRTEQDLPRDEVISSNILELVNELERLSKSERLERCIVPVLFEGQAACIFFKNLLSTQLLGDREKSDKGNLMLEPSINRKIMPDFITIVDDPTINEFNGHLLYGNYEFDDEGVKSRRVTLVENGFLRGFLLTRTPIKSCRIPTGHARSYLGQPVPSVSNFIVSSSKLESHAKLGRKLLELARKVNKPFGLVISSMESSGMPILAYKIDAKTAKEELVRNINVLNLPLSCLDKIVACGGDYHVYSENLETIPTSYVAPNVLISELEIQPIAEKPKRAPLLPAPWAK